MQLRVPLDGVELLVADALLADLSVLAGDLDLAVAVRGLVRVRPAGGAARLVNLASKPPLVSRLPSPKMR